MADYVDNLVRRRAAVDHLGTQPNVPPGAGATWILAHPATACPSIKDEGVQYQMVLFCLTHVRMFQNAKLLAIEDLLGTLAKLVSTIHVGLTRESLTLMRYFVPNWWGGRNSGDDLEDRFRLLAIHERCVVFRVGRRVGRQFNGVEHGHAGRLVWRALGCVPFDATLSFRLWKPQIVLFFGLKNVK